eukprot:Clim_evm35s231 gene=Clim_evmTU35s231
MGGSQEKETTIWQQIQSHEQSRRIFWYLMVTCSFAFVEFFFGWYTNSLSLISDSFHMAFDSTALIIGLAATLVSFWPADERYNFGYGRSEAVGSLIIALSLAVSGLMVLQEGIQRLYIMPEIDTKGLLLVSTLGFLVNLLGIFMLGDADELSVVHKLEALAEKSEEMLSSSSQNGVGKKADLDNEVAPKAKNTLMNGVMLHVVMDTLGSLGVMFSTFMIKRYGYLWVDPICAIGVAILILTSVYPLLRDTFEVLMEGVPWSVKPAVDACRRDIQAMPAVRSVVDYKAWAVDYATFNCNVRIEVGSERAAQHNDIVAAVQKRALGHGLKNCFVEVLYVDGILVG